MKRTRFAAALLLSAVLLSLALPHAASAAALPDWSITEICTDTFGNGVGGYTDGKDVFEFFELCNTSGRTLNLYDYALTYFASDRSNAGFEKQMTKYTPFLPGNFLDGSSVTWSATDIPSGDGSNLPVNPAECLVAPGEIVVVWSMFYESHLAEWNSGRGMSMADFRAFWGIPEDVKCIAWDGNNNVDHGGQDKNFNMKNSGVGTYGLVRKSDAIAKTANKNSSYNVSFTECADLAAWVSVDFNAQITAKANQNLTQNFVPDLSGIAAAQFSLKPDVRRMMLTEANTQGTPGKLTTLQKMLLGLPLAAGDTLALSSVYAPASPEGTFLGLELGGTLYQPGSTFTVPQDGTVTVAYRFFTDVKGEPLTASEGGVEYRTYTIDDVEFVANVVNPVSGGNTHTATQSMDAGERYIYSAHVYNSNASDVIMRYDTETGKSIPMNYYLNDTVKLPTVCATLGHANELSVVRIDGTDYLFVATMNVSDGIAKLRIDGENLYYAGHFPIRDTAGGAVNITAITEFARRDGVTYFILKQSKEMRLLALPDNAKSGTALTAPIFFTIRESGARVVEPGGKLAVYSDLDSWTQQGSFYCPEEQSLYVPIWHSDNGGESMILVYDLSALAAEDFTARTTDSSTVLTPGPTTFHIVDPTTGKFEIESCGYRRGDTGDLCLYFNINHNTASKEGIYRVLCSRGGSETPTAPIEPPTAAPTAEPTALPTDAPTEAPANPDATDAPKPGKGCGSFAAPLFFVLLPAFPVALLRRKKH